MNDDLIFRSALCEKLQAHHDFFVNAWGGFSNLPTKDKARVDEITHCIAETMNAPAVDAVPVVRCKDCKHRGDDVCCPMCFEEESVIDEGDGYFDTDYITHDRTVDDGFCDRGERRADE